MKCVADLDVLKYKLSLLPLQVLHKKKLVSFENIRVLKEFLECYKLTINQFHKLDKNRWNALSDIGLKELDDHMKILVNATSSKLQSVNYNDCHNYLTSSIQDAIDYKKLNFK
jgi:hypothetical protein